VLLSAIAVVAAAFTFWTGSVGIMPLDQSIIFDGGWRVLSGQVPWIDFHTPSGTVPILLQAVLFKLLDVSWTTYVLHAAVTNILYAYFVYALLHKLFHWNILAFYFAVLSAFFMYPPMGTPFMDQHAMILTFCVLGLFLWGALADASKSRAFAWFLMPIVAVLAFHSKQIPSGPAILFIGAAATYLLIRRPEHYREAYIAALAGSALVLPVLLVIIYLTGGFDRYFFWHFEMPMAQASARAAVSTTRLAVVWGLSVASALPILIGLYLSLRFGTNGARGLVVMPVAAVTIGLLILSASLAAITMNAPIIALAYFPAEIALCYYLLSKKRRAKFPETTQNLYSFRALLLTLSALAALYSVLPVSKRLMNEFHDTDLSASISAETIHPQLAGLQWITPRWLDQYGNERTPSAYRALVDEIATRPGNFMLVGDASILYGVTGKPSVLPSLWFHEGLSIPYEPSPARAAFEVKLTRSLARNDVQYVILDGVRTWMGSRWQDFAVLRACLYPEDPKTKLIGRFRVIPIASDCIRRNIPS
jgi:hypothetical protein